MPTYEFRCPDGTIIERVFRISEVPQEIPVPDGEGMATRIISGGAALLFKGSGFYITDYGKDGKKDQRSANESKTGGDAKSTGESKPAGDSVSAKTESKPSSSEPKSSSSDSKPAPTAPASPKSE